MLKYVIIPRWLYVTSRDNNIAISDLLNFEISESILSPIELIFYIRTNIINYDDFFISKNSNKLLKLLKSSKCLNMIANNSAFINYITDREKIPVSNESFLRNLLENPIYPLTKNGDITDINFETQRIDTNVLAFIPTIKDLNLKDYSIRRDIYKVMRSFMSGYDVVQSPIFGI